MTSLRIQLDKKELETINQLLQVFELMECDGLFDITDGMALFLLRLQENDASLAPLADETLQSLQEVFLFIENSHIEEGYPHTSIDYNDCYTMVFVLTTALESVMRLRLALLQKETQLFLTFERLLKRER